MLRKGLCVAGVAAAVATISVSPASATVFILNSGNDSVGSITVTGSITTDGTTGTLSPGNIVAWNIFITNGSSSVDLTEGNSSIVTQNASELSVSSNELLYDFSQSGEGFSFDATSGGGLFQLTDNFTAHNLEVCITSSICAGANPTTSVEIGAATPEPAAWALMLAGFAGLGAALRTRRGKLAAG